MNIYLLNEYDKTRPWSKSFHELLLRVFLSLIWKVLSLLLTNGAPYTIGDHNLGNEGAFVSIKVWFMGILFINESKPHYPNTLMNCGISLGAKHNKFCPFIKAG